MLPTYRQCLVKLKITAVERTDTSLLAILIFVVAGYFQRPIVPLQAGNR